MSGYELTISSYNDASSGVYPTKLDAMQAADAAAAVDGLITRYGNWCSGFFTDESGHPWFHFSIRWLGDRDEYVLMALDSGETLVLHGRDTVAGFASEGDLYVDGGYLCANNTDIRMYSVVMFPAEVGT